MDQQLQDLIEELRRLVPTLKSLGPGAGTSPGGLGDRGIDKLISALGKLNIAIENTTTGLGTAAKNDLLALQKFASEVEESADNVEQLIKAEKELKRATREAAETTAQAARLAAMSARERKEYEEQEAKKLAKIKNDEALKDLLSAKEARTSAALYVDEMFRGLTMSKMVNRSVENLAGENVALLITLRALTTGVEAAVDSLAKISGAIGRFLLDLGNGAKSFTQLNPIIDAVSSSLGALASKIPIVGGILEAGIKAAAEGSKFVLDQLQKTSDAFNELAQVGGITANGMSGLQKQFIDSGMTLDGYKRVITENASTLAKFSGTVGQGGDTFSKFVGDIVTTNAGDALRRIGYSADQIGESAGAFLTQQTRLGLAQRKNTAQLTQGTIQYAKELDLLTKVTGMNRKEIQAQQDAALSEGRFRAQIDEMIAEGNEDSAKALLDFQTQVNRVSPEFGAAIRDVSTGLVNSDAAIKGFNSTGGQIQNIVNSLKTGEIDQAEALRRLQAATREAETNQRGYAKAVGDSQDVFVKYAEVSDLNRATIEGNLLKAQKAQNAQIAGQDDLTNQTITAQKQLEQLSRQITLFGFAAMPKATDAVVAFTGALNKFVKYVGKELGINLPEIGSVGSPTDSEPTKPESQAKKEKKAEADRVVADNKFEQAALVTDQIKAAEAEYKNMLKSQASQEALTAQRERIRTLEAQREKLEKEAVESQRAANQSALEAANERKRLRKIENQASFYESQIKESNEKILSLRDKRSKLEEAVANAEKTGMPPALVEARKKAILATDEEIANAQKRLAKATEDLAAARKELGKPAGAKPLADLIARGESRGDYNAANYAGGRQVYAPGQKNLTDMTIADLMQEQKTGQIFAAGRYQVTPNTLKEAVKTLGLKQTDKFDQATQDKIFNEFLIGAKRPEVQKVVQGKADADVDKAIIELAKEFASVGVPKAMQVTDEYGTRNIRKGEGYYAGVGANPLGPASITPEQIKEALVQTAKNVQMPTAAQPAKPDEKTAKATDAKQPQPAKPDEKTAKATDAKQPQPAKPDEKTAKPAVAAKPVVPGEKPAVAAKPVVPGEKPAVAAKPVVPDEKPAVAAKPVVIDTRPGKPKEKPVVEKPAVAAKPVVPDTKLDEKPVVEKPAVAAKPVVIDTRPAKPDEKPVVEKPAVPTEKFDKPPRINNADTMLAVNSGQRQADFDTFYKSIITGQKIEGPKQEFTPIDVQFKNQLSDLVAEKTVSNNNLIVAMKDLTEEISKANRTTTDTPNMHLTTLLSDLVSLQSRNNATAERLLQVSQS